MDVFVAILITTLAIALFALLLFLASTIVIHCYMDNLLKTLKNCKKYKTELLDWSSKQIVENTQLLFWENFTGYRYVNELTTSY